MNLVAVTGVGRHQAAHVIAARCRLVLDQIVSGVDRPRHVSVTAEVLVCAENVTIARSSVATPIGLGTVESRCDRIGQFSRGVLTLTTRDNCDATSKATATIHDRTSPYHTRVKRNGSLPKCQAVCANQNSCGRQLFRDSNRRRAALHASSSRPDSKPARTLE